MTFFSWYAFVSFQLHFSILECSENYTLFTVIRTCICEIRVSELVDFKNCLSFVHCLVVVRVLIAKFVVYRFWIFSYKNYLPCLCLRFFFFLLKRFSLVFSCYRTATSV